MPAIGAQSVPKLNRVRTYGTSTVSTDTVEVPGGFSPGNLQVYLDGVAIAPSDYDDSDGLNVVFAATLDLGTEYHIIEAQVFAAANAPTLVGGSQADFSAMPQVGGDPIIESGSNADGEWTRSADGTQWVHFPSSSDAAIDRTWTFPVAFITKAERTATPATGLTGNVSAFFRNDAAITSSDYAGYNSAGARAAMTLSLTAIGRWK